MAAFEPGAELVHEPDWELWQYGFVRLFYSRDLLAETQRWLADHGYQVVVLDAAPWVDESRFHSDIATGLGFPSWYGHNLNALNDCLSDLAEGQYGLSRDATGLVLVLLNYDSLLLADPYLTERILDIWAGQARHAALVGHRLMCLVQSDDPRIELPPVGAQAVSWNSAEWADRARGL